MAIVTAVEVLGNINIAITTPSAMSVPMRTNGETLRIATSGSVSLAAFTDAQLATLAAGIRLTVTDRGHDQTGAQVNQTRTVGCTAVLRGPWQNTSQKPIYQPNAGEFYVVVAETLFNQDATWKSTVTAVNFAAGWLPGATVEVVGGLAAECCTRSDSLAYSELGFPIAVMSDPYTRVGPGGTLHFEVCGAHSLSRNGQPWACIEAQPRDSAGTLGTLVRQGVFAKSSKITNAPGLPWASYEVQVDPTGLLDGRCQVEVTAKPWVGPPVSSAVVGDTVFPTMGLPVGLPFCKDFGDGSTYAGNYAPLYGVIAQIPSSLPAGQTLAVASTTVVTTANLERGLSLTIAGAQASGFVYPDYATFWTAVRKVNIATANLNIADPVSGAVTYAYKRPQAHTTLAGLDATNGSIGGGCAVLLPIAGSTRGSATGAYTNRVNFDATTFPPGWVAAEVRSLSGLTSDTVRMRGELAEAPGTAGSTRRARRMRWRGVTFDSLGVSTAALNGIFDGQSVGTPTTQPTENAAQMHFYVDCARLEADPTVLNVGTNSQIGRQGYFWDTRVEHANAYASGSFCNSDAYFQGFVASRGGYYHNPEGKNYAIPLSRMVGARLDNMVLSDQAAGPRPDFTHRLASNFKIEFTSTTTNPSVAPIGIGGSNRTQHDGLGLVNFLLVSNGPVTVVAALGLFATYGNNNANNIIIQGGAQYNRGIPSDQQAYRWNFGYNCTGNVSMPNRITLQACAGENIYAVKGDDFDTAAIPVNEAPYSATYTYGLGEPVTSGGVQYQSLTAGNLNNPVTDTANWRVGPAAGSTYGRDPRRQGNASIRYHVNNFGTVQAAADGEHTIGQTETNSTSGLCWDIGGQLGGFAATDLYSETATFTPTAGGVLASRIPAARAFSPIDVFGNARRLDGTGYGGAVEGRVIQLLTPGALSMSGFG